MNNSRTIETVRSSDLVTFKILIEGTELSAVHQVKNISVEKEINRIPFAQVVFLDGEAASQNFNLSNEDLLVPGKDIEIKAGYHNDEETIFKGIIIKHSIKIRENNSVLIVECRDEAVKMTIGRKSNFYYESKDSDIIEEIIGKYSLENEIESTSFINKEMVQYRASDWDFIMTRAQLNGQICTVDDGKIKISKPDLSQAEIETVAFGSTLLDFDAEMDARNQFNSITAYGWNPSEQEIIDAEANDPGISLNGNISVSDLAEVINLENLELKHGGNYNSTQLQNWSDAKNLFQQLSKTRGRVKFQGIPTVKPGTMLKLEGVGVRFNGKIFISSVRHEIVNGNWTVDAEFGMNPKWFSETYDVSELPAAGIIPAVSGLQVGVVSQLESDPDGEDRILVKIPIIDKDEQGIWTRIATLDAGNNRGSFFLPEIGDEVIVGFVNDDPNHAVILGMLHSSAKPAPLTASDDNHEKGFVTRSELKLIFNDEKKSIIIETPGGKKVTIDEDAGVIKIEDDNRNIITMGNGGIAMESGKDFSIKATGDCNIEAMNVNVKANAQFKAQGNAGAEVSTSAITVLKGSLVQIN